MNLQNILLLAIMAVMYGIGFYLNEPKELKKRLYINELEPSSIRKHTHSINFELIDDFN